MRGQADGQRVAGIDAGAVSPRYIPTASHRAVVPRRRGRKWLDPMSGTNPMAVSGMAIVVFSVVTRTAPCTEIPSPPPIVTPLRTARYGFG